MSWEAKKTRGNGAVTLTIERKVDYDGYASISYWLGKYSVKESPNDFSYFRREDVMLCPDGTWRDRRGRFASEPKSNPYSRSCQWIVVEKDQAETVKNAFCDVDRLEAYERGDWCSIGIVASVHVDGVEVAESSVWGFESDMPEKDLRYEERNVAGMALQEAREWFNRRKG